MGDRISIQFKNGDQTSVVLFSHWGGQSFLKETNEYAEKLKSENKNNSILNPIDHLEPKTVIVDFIRHFTKDMGSDERIKSNIYLGKDKNDGDNSDNGHYIIDLTS